MDLDKVSVSFSFPAEISLKDIMKKMLFNHSLSSFLMQSRGVSVTITVEEDTKANEKKRMYAYLNGVLIPAVMKAKRNEGEVMDKLECMIAMKMLFAKDVMDKGGDQVFVLLSQSDMSKTRLTHFITDIIFHLEMEYGVQAPDAAEYKLKKLNAVKKTNYKRV